MITPRLLLFCTASCFLIHLAPSTAHAKPAHLRALGDYLGPFATRNLLTCRTCHQADKPSDEEHTHNAFGARLAEVKDQLRAAGKKADLAIRLDTVADEDSDGDRVANLVELLSGNLPGDAQSKPGQAEVTATLDRTLHAYREFRSAYPWKPFEAVQRPVVPAVKDAGWVRNPIDAFIAAEREKRGLHPRPEALRPLLLRRLYIDLIGLPPTPEEQRAFLDDPALDAYEKVVDRLLASPRYGERWGRHWMDVWRYSDVDGTGNQIYSQPHIWRWRDWIIEALNEDKSYERMILEMLAADELVPDDTRALRATGFLVRNYNQFYPQVWLQDTVEYTSQALLGLTLRCARCHDHKYDPVLQTEYYQVTAVFQPHQVRTDHVPGQPDPRKDGLVRVFDGNPKAETFLFIKGDLQKPDKTSVQPGVPASLGGRFPTVESVPLPAAAYVPEKRDFVVEMTIATSEAGVIQANGLRTTAQRNAAVAVATLFADLPLPSTTRLATLQKTLDTRAQAEAEAEAAAARHTALVAVVRAERLEDQGKKDSDEWKAAATAAMAAQRQVAVLEARKVLLTAQQAHQGAPEKTRADAAKKLTAAEQALTKVEADAKAPPATNYTKRQVKAHPQASTGRRLAFARWIADRDNPLTARVAMNHTWLRHFGQAIVPRVFDLGGSGPSPLHPALLDWLAVEFMERGWSMKAMHRLMVTSSTYRMASTPDAANAAGDPDNRYYWRMPSRRIEAEVVRDTIFFLAGKLNQATGGPEIDHAQGLTVPRRSIYFRHAEDKQMPFLKIFDGPSAMECYQRAESIVPQQALALANSELTRTHARLLAESLRARVGADPAEYTKAAFAHVLCRPPTPEELAACTDFLHGKASEPAAVRAFENLVHGLMSHYEFRTVR